MAQIGETELDVHALARALWRRSWLLVLIALAAGAATYLALAQVAPLYRADSSILIEERESPLTRPREQNSVTTAFDESAIQSQVEVLRSREIATDVIKRLDLLRRPEFDPARQPSVLQALLVSVGLKEHPAAASIEQRVMDFYFERLSVYPLSKSRVIGVEFSASAPQLAAEVANTIAESFVDLQQDAKRESALAATSWLEKEIDRLRGRLAQAEQAVAAYRTRNGLFNADQSGNLSTQQLGDMNAELSRARAARAEAQARAELVKSLLSEGGALEASEEVLDSQLIQRLQERQVALRAQIAELSTTLLPGHPRIRALSGQLRNLEGQIRQEAEKIEASLNTAARVAAAREESLQASLNEAKSAVSSSNEQEIELRALEREAAAQRDLLESFMGRYREAVARTDADYLPADARIISRAVAPQEPSYPKKGVMSVAAAIAALLLASAILLMREFMSGRVFRVIGDGDSPLGSWSPHPNRAEPFREPQSVPQPAITLLAAAAPDHAARAAEAFQDAKTPPAGETPIALGEGDVAILLPQADPDPDSMLTASADDIEAVEASRPSAPAVEGDRPGTAELGDIIANSAVRLALFAGAQGGEGAGDIAFAAARHAARANLRLVLLDVGATPSPALGGYDLPGLGDLLAGEAAFGEVIRRDEGARVHVITMGSIELNPPLQRLQIVIGALTNTYDKVIVVADTLSDWPHEHIQPQLAAIVCGPETTELLRTELYEAALERGAESALIVRYASDQDEMPNHTESEAA